jgi:hypothetical protein
MKWRTTLAILLKVSNQNVRSLTDDLRNLGITDFIEGKRAGAIFDNDHTYVVITHGLPFATNNDVMALVKGRNGSYQQV